MVKIIDTYSQINSLFENETLNLDSGLYTFEKDFLPIINAVNNNPSLELIHNSFVQVTENLNDRIMECFGEELDVEIVLYLGLCNAAGWVTNINGKDTVLLGVEKIIELNWQDIDSMYGLIYHELGHVYQNSMVF